MKSPGYSMAQQHLKGPNHHYPPRVLVYYTSSRSYGARKLLADIDESRKLSLGGKNTFGFRKILKKKKCFFLMFIALIKKFRLCLVL